MNLLLQRTRCDRLCTRGELTVGSLLLQTLELPWDDNARDKSCVPQGDYDLIPYDSATHGLVWRLHAPYLNVYGQGLVPEGARSGIEIHAGNFRVDTLGCILVGLQGTADSVALSDEAMIQLRALLGPTGEHSLIIDGV